MTTPKPKVHQRDIARILREADKHPRVKRVDVDLGEGKVSIFLADGEPLLVDSHHDEPPREAMFQIRAVPKKKVVL